MDLHEDHPRPGPAKQGPAGQYTIASAPERRSWLKPLLLLLLLAVIGLVAWRLLSGSSATRSARNADAAAQPVGVATIGTGDLRLTYNGLGTVTPLASVTVKTQIAGQLMSVGYTEGQAVKKGDFLAQIDPRPYQVSLEQAQGQLAKDTALLKQAQTDLQRYETLNRQNSISKQQYEDQVFLVQQDQAAITTDQAAIDSAKLNLTYCHIVSPVDGRVGLRLVDPGNYVQTGDATGLVTITQTKPMTVIFTLPEDDVPQVAKAMHAGALSVAIFDRANATQIATGTLQTLDNAIDTTTGTVRLRAQFANDDDALFPQQFVNAELLVQTIKGATTAPVAAVQQGAPGPFVYLVKSDSTVAVQSVKTGITDNGMVQIQDGLKPGDQVVVDGADRLRDGARITIPPPAGSTPDQAPSNPKGGRSGRKG
ncbi:transport system membrane protein [Aliidongia dinghuensis]|uniref:Transport system membrane protein n=1 Tax=Aliidongia dinghuensis TaxID=1867774 RepID=A0A8J2YYR3_9PROT|nr:MdtA/MuxA family multidrug efflux RND transporter periplasmic adaptor subunit [Aliidongia dinghuensis]GGF39864.1 transport system membrane protein [Aliidongia dinghuensis]